MPTTVAGWSVCALVVLAGIIGIVIFKGPTEDSHSDGEWDTPKGYRPFERPSEAGQTVYQKGIAELDPKEPRPVFRILSVNGDSAVVLYPDGTIEQKSISGLSEFRNRLFLRE